MKLRTLFLSLSPLLGLGVVVWFALQAGVSLAGMTELVPLPFHLLALGAFFLSVLGRGVRIALLARGLGSRLRILEAMAVQLTGEAAGAATPSRSGSDPARVLFMKKRAGLDVPTGVGVLAGEIMAEGIVLGVAVATLLLVLPEPRMVVLGALPYSITALTLPLSAFLLLRRPAPRQPPRIWAALRLTERRWRGFRGGARRFRSSAMALARLDRPTIGAVLLVSLVHLLARLAILPVLVLGHGTQAPLGPLVAWPLVLLYAGSLLPPPGGGGAIEVTFIAALASVVGEVELVGTLLWWRVYTFYLGAVVGGLILVLALGRQGLSELGPGRKDAQVPAPGKPILQPRVR